MRNKETLDHYEIYQCGDTQTLYQRKTSSTCLDSPIALTLIQHSQT